MALDLEGVLAPEFWVAVAGATGIDELRRTTRDEPDYPSLMRRRVELLDRHHVPFSRITGVVAELAPLGGAPDFLARLAELADEVVIVSDTFEQLAAPFMARLGNPRLMCHQLRVEGDRIAGWSIAASHKTDAIEAVRRGGSVIAVGDGFNDLAMLRASDWGLLYRPSAAVRAVAPDLPRAESYDAACGRLAQAAASLRAGMPARPPG